MQILTAVYCDIACNKAVYCILRSLRSLYSFTASGDMSRSDRFMRLLSVTLMKSVEIADECWALLAMGLLWSLQVLSIW